MLRRDILRLLGWGSLFPAELAAAGPKTRPLRAVLVTSGKYDRYRRILTGVLEGFAALDLVDSERLSTVLSKARHANRHDTADLWAGMAGDLNGRLQFLADGHYDYDFRPDQRLTTRETVLDRIREANDVDIVFTFGTAASFDMAHLVDRVPVVSLGSSDPVATGVILSAEDSGKDNVHAIVIHHFLRNQVKTFYAIRPFKRLGFVCAEGEEKKFGAKEVVKASYELGADCVHMSFKDDETQSLRDRFPAFFEAVKRLIDTGIDTLMLPWFPASERQLSELVRYLVDRRVWSYSLSGPAFVSRGILLGVGEESFEGYGLFEARVIRRILEGDKPRAIGQVFVRQTQFSVNLRTAMQLGWQVPFEILATADRTYTSQSIE